jgi:hypothetical protein
MKSVILTLGLLGAFAILALGGTWWIDGQKHRQSISRLQRSASDPGFSAFATTQMGEIDATSQKAAVLLGLGVIAFGATLLTLRFAKIAASILMLIAVACIWLTPMSLIFSSPLMAAGALALLSRTRSTRSLL